MHAITSFFVTVIFFLFFFVQLRFLFLSLSRIYTAGNLVCTKACDVRYVTCVPDLCPDSDCVMP